MPSGRLGNQDNALGFRAGRRPSGTYIILVQTILNSLPKDLTFHRPSPLEQSQSPAAPFGFLPTAEDLFDS